MKFREDNEEELSINLTPLIDVVFLLLIFFMVSTTFSKESELNIRLPEAQADSSAQPDQEVIVIEVSPDGVFAVRSPGSEDAQRLVDSETETLVAALRGAAAGETDMVTIIRADERTPHQFVVRAMDASRRLGLLRITFATQTPSESESG